MIKRYFSLITIMLLLFLNSNNVNSFPTIRMMMDPAPGIRWVGRISATVNNWNSVTYGNGLFVAVSSNGVGNRVMTSPDGISWTIRASAVDSDWQAVTYGNGLFVAVANWGAGNRVMTSH